MAASTRRIPNIAPNSPDARKREGLAVNIHARTALAGFLLIATFILWKEHWSHFLCVLPWGILLLCPILYLLTYRRHGGHGDRESHGSREASHGSPRMDQGEEGE